MKDMHHAALPFRPIGRTSLLPLLAVAAASLLISACGKTETAASTAPSQVAAKVDGTEISVHQINYVMTRSKVNADSPEAAQALRKQVLEKLVDQQLLVQKATEDKLDRTPDVQMALEAARRDVLADAYLQQATVPASKAEDVQIRLYYTDHPELFSQRRIFQLQEISYAATAPADVQSAVKAAVESGKPIDETIKLLSARGVEFARADSQRAAEQIALDLLPRLNRLSAGQGAIAGNGKVVTVVYVKSYEQAPVSREAATPRIAQFLSNQNLSQNVSELVKNLRTKAKIEYVGDFAATDAANPK